MNVGFIGFGEAAYNIALGFYQEGLTGICAYDAMMHDTVMGPQVTARAKEAHVTLFESATEIAEWADIIFAAVPSSFTLDVCKEIKDCFTADKLYVDVSASTPKVKEEIWSLIKDSGVQFVDAAMMGSLPKDKQRVPITASGNGVKKLMDTLVPYGMCITPVGDTPGAASAIKLIRSIFMKGIAALMIETVEAAEAYGVDKEVIGSLSKSWDGTPFEAHLHRLISGTAVHCIRRAAELKGSLQLLEDKGIATDMTHATKARTEALGKYKFAEHFVNHPPKTWQEIIAYQKEVDKK